MISKRSVHKSEVLAIIDMHVVYMHFVIKGSDHESIRGLITTSLIPRDWGYRLHHLDHHKALHVHTYLMITCKLYKVGRLLKL